MNKNSYPINRFKNAIQWVVLVAAVLLLNACASSSKIQFYNLISTANQQITPSIPAEVNVGISSWVVPDYLQNPAIVSTKSQQHELLVSALNAWGGDFSSSLVRVSATNIGTQLGHARIWPAPWSHKLNPQYKVQVILQRLDGPLGGEVNLIAKWVITGDYGRTELVTKDSHIVVSATNKQHSGYVEAINEVLAELCAEIATELAQIDYSADQ